MKNRETQPIPVGELVTLYEAGCGPRITFDKEALESLRAARRIAASRGSPTIELADLAAALNQAGASGGFAERFATVSGGETPAAEPPEDACHRAHIGLPRLGEAVLDVIEAAACDAVARGDGSIRATDLWNRHARASRRRARPVRKSERAVA
jgi:hypothetical protein